MSFANQADFNAFVTGLGARNNLRELRVQAVANGTRMIAKFEDGRVRTEVRDGNRGPGSEHSGRDQARGDRDDRRVAATAAIGPTGSSATTEATASSVSNAPNAPIDSTGRSGAAATRAGIS